MQQPLQRASEFHLANEQGDGDKQCEREAGDECLVHRRGLRDGTKMGSEMAEQAGWKCYEWAAIDFDVFRPVF